MTSQTTHEHVVAAARDYLIGLQSRITSAIEAKDGQAKFLVDKWEKGPGEQQWHHPNLRKRPRV
jgi:coproporphyrinogen III oxidase